MGGIMPDRARDAAIERLRKAACTALQGSYEHERADALRRLREAWREFPENYYDQQTPAPDEALRLCTAYDRQKAEAERVAAR